MKIITQLLFFGFLFISPMLMAQHQIQEVEVEGLKETKLAYLSHFIDTKEGETLDSLRLQKDLQRLRNLYAVANVKAQIDTLKEGLKVTFQVEEAWTFFPIINFGGIRGNFWFQLGFTDVNWLGKGKQLTAIYRNNDLRQNYQLYLRAPFLQGSRWGFSSGLQRFASVEPLYFGDQTVFYDYTNLSATLTGIYQLDRNQYFESGVTFFNEDFQKNARHAGEATPGPFALNENKILIKAIHDINRINYDYFYESGFLNHANWQSVYNFAKNNWFHIFLNDAKYYRRIGKRGNFASRLRIGISTNTNSPFAPFVLDSYVNIRGAGNRIDRGTAALIANLEYRYAFWDKRRFAAQVVGFSDVGTWRDPGGSLTELWDREQFRHFAGGGLRLIYKQAYNAILRVDYGVDIYAPSQRGWVIGIGQYF